MADTVMPTVGIAEMEFNTQTPLQAYSEEFRNVIEAHVPYLRYHNETVELNVTDYLEYVKKYDLDGLLFALNVNPICYFAVLRVNNLDSQIQDISKLESLLIPSAAEISRLLQNELTKPRR